MNDFQNDELDSEAETVPTDVSATIELSDDFSHQTPPEPNETPVEPELLYPTMEEFLTDYLTLMYEVPMITGRRTWCPEWWKHAGAAIRIQALWMSWEDARRNGGLSGLASWIVNHADPIMNVLFETDGVFKSCSIERGHREDRPNPEGRLPTEPAPSEIIDPRA